MDDYIREAEARFAAQKQQRAFESLKRERRRQDDKAALVSAIEAIKQSAVNVKAPDATMVDMAAKHTQILDGLFDHYLEKSKDYYKHDDAMAMALKTHQQAVRALYIWHKLKS